MVIERVRFRLTPRQVVVEAVPLVVSYTLLVLAFAAIGGGTGALLMGAAVVLSVAGLTAAFRWWGLELRPDAAVIRSNVRHVVAWDDVIGVRTRKRGLVTHLVIETGSRSYRLRAPSTGVIAVDPHFADKVAYVEQWWLAHRQVTGHEPWPPMTDTGWGRRVAPPAASP